MRAVLWVSDLFCNHFLQLRNHAPGRAPIIYVARSCTYVQANVVHITFHYLFKLNNPLGLFPFQRSTLSISIQFDTPKLR